MAQTDFTIAGVLAWARTKPADETYDFICADLCALGQFAREKCGISKEDAGLGDYEDQVPDELMRAANAPPEECTFGAFAKRLEALCPDAPVTKSDWLSIDAYLTEQVSA